ncbi:hypothetical protein [Pseudomonas sp. PMCC200344]|uniref:hypothetical protein n=1 Tax=Pseudomonas sp. PMCC200344 TaxID=3042028 RepID=UPI0024B3509D|nr:hypothetical protein [Pseudomonas sp. PMCC200344]
MSDQQVTEILAPIVEAPQRNETTDSNPTISGTCAEGASVWVKSALPGESWWEYAEVTGKQWSYTSFKAWGDGEKAIKAQQSLGGDTSPYSESRAFRVFAVPVIRSPAPGAVTGNNPTISGTCAEGASVWVKSALPGESWWAYVEVTGKQWSYTSPTVWGDGEKAIKVQQSLAGVTSPYSEPLNFTVALSPFVPPPLILRPLPYSFTAQDQLITGSDQSAINLQLLDEVGTPIAGEFSKETGRWTFRPARFWEPGLHQIRLKRGSALNAPQSELRAFSVRPPVPVITDPADQGSAHPVQAIKGKGAPGAVYTVQDVCGVPVKGTFEIHGDEWIFTPVDSWLRENKVRVTQTLNGVKSHPGSIHTFYRI